MARLSATEVEKEAKKYNRLKDRRGVFSKLVGKFGQLNAKRIIAKAEKLRKVKEPKKAPKKQAMKPKAQGQKRIMLKPQDVFSVHHNKKAKGVTWEPWEPDDPTWLKGLLPEYEKQKKFDKFPVVVNIAGKRWEIDLVPRPKLREDPYVQDGEWTTNKRRMSFTPTKKALTKESKASHPLIYMFGQHESVQHGGDLFPVDNKGKIIPHLMTVENDWGDAGNEVYFLGLNTRKNPSILLFEASCG